MDLLTIKSFAFCYGLYLFVYFVILAINNVRFLNINNRLFSGNESWTCCVCCKMENNFKFWLIEWCTSEALSHLAWYLSFELRADFDCCRFVPLIRSDLMRKAAIRYITYVCLYILQRLSAARYSQDLAFLLKYFYTFRIWLKSCKNGRYMLHNFVYFKIYFKIYSP